MSIADSHCLLSRHKYFNTNNLWVNLPSLKATLDESKGVLQLPLIKNKKTVNPRDSDTPAVFQLETAMGSAIECFNDAGAVVVPRDRFAPVKTCNDLFALRSDVYEVGSTVLSRVHLRICIRCITLTSSASTPGRQLQLHAHVWLHTSKQTVIPLNCFATISS